jgi:hypothetical protein
MEFNLLFEGLVLFYWILYYIVFCVCVVITKWGRGQTVAHWNALAALGCHPVLLIGPFKVFTDEMNVYHCCAVYV